MGQAPARPGHGEAVTAGGRRGAGADRKRRRTGRRVRVERRGRSTRQPADRQVDLVAKTATRCDGHRIAGAVSSHDRLARRRNRKVVVPDGSRCEGQLRHEGRPLAVGRAGARVLADHPDRTRVHGVQAGPAVIAPAVEAGVQTLPGLDGLRRHHDLRGRAGRLPGDADPDVVGGGGDVVDHEHVAAAVQVHRRVIEVAPRGAQIEVLVDGRSGGRELDQAWTWADRRIARRGAGIVAHGPQQPVLKDGGEEPVVVRLNRTGQSRLIRRRRLRGSRDSRIGLIPDQRPI